MSWISHKREITGIARVFLDGTLQEEVDTCSPTSTEFQVPVFTHSGLASGTHTLEIEVIGITGGVSPTPGCENSWIVVDAFDVTP